MNSQELGKNNLQNYRKDDKENMDYLLKYNFSKTLPKLIKKLKNKTVVLYGVGILLDLIKENFDLSGINIIAVSDRKFKNSDVSEYSGYKTCAPEDIEKLNPDYVLISTKFYMNIYEYLSNELLKNTGIKILPLVEKPFLTLFKETFFYIKQ